MYAAHVIDGREPVLRGELYDCCSVRSETASATTYERVGRVRADGREGGLEIAPVLELRNDVASTPRCRAAALHCWLHRRCLRVSGFHRMATRVTGIASLSSSSRLPATSRRVDATPGDVPAGPREARDEPAPRDRLTRDHDDRNRASPA